MSLGFRFVGTAFSFLEHCSSPKGVSCWVSVLWFGAVCDSFWGYCIPGVWFLVLQFCAPNFFSQLVCFRVLHQRQGQPPPAPLLLLLFPRHDPRQLNGGARSKAAHASLEILRPPPLKSFPPVAFGCVGYYILKWVPLVRRGVVQAENIPLSSRPLFSIE